MTPVVLSSKSMKFLDGLDAKQYRQIGKRIWGLQEDGSPHDVKYLSGHPATSESITENFVLFSVGKMGSLKSP